MEGRVYLCRAPHGPAFAEKGHASPGDVIASKEALIRSHFSGTVQGDGFVKIIRARTSLKQRGLSQKLAKRLRKAPPVVTERLEAYVRASSRP